MSCAREKLMQSCEELLEKVRCMPAGGDLESLIENQLEHMNQQVYEMALESRHETNASAPAEDFSPSDMPRLPSDAGKAPSVAAPGADAAG